MEFSMHLKELKSKNPADLVSMAEELGVEGASTLRKQDLMFAILKELAEDGEQIMGLGTIEVLPDSFGFLRSPEANYLAGPDDIYVSPNMVRQFGLRTGDTVEGEIRAPKDGERYFALTKVMKINFDDPDAVRHRVNFDNLTPLYPDEKLTLDSLDPTVKDKSARVIDIVSPQGKGQRALIVAPPRTGKTVLLQNIARAITDNHPEVFLIVLLIDERPAEVCLPRLTSRQRGTYRLRKWSLRRPNVSLSINMMLSSCSTLLPVLVEPIIPLCRAPERC
jgi:transcription termination factor Rho